MGSVVKRFFKTAYDLFPIFNCPMAACSVLAIAAVLYLYKHSDKAIPILVLYLIFAVAVCLITRSKKSVIVSVLFLAVCASAVNEFALISDLNELDGKTVSADFVAVEDSEYSGKVSRVTAYCCNSDVIPINSKFVLYSFSDVEICCGDKFNAEVKIKELEKDTYLTYNYGNSVYADCRLKKINKHFEPNAFFLAVGKIRSYIIRTIKNNFSDNTARLMIALNCGDKSYLTDEFYSKVLVCGVSHVMVVSGLHIAIILGSLFTFCERFFYNRFLKAAVSLGIIFLLCAVCGFTLSVVRSSAMFVFSAAAPIFGRKSDPLNSLGSAIILMLYISPLCIFSVAFQLSALSTLAVVWISPFYSKLIAKILKLKSRFAKGAVEMFTVSIMALIFTAPITIAVFGTVSALAPVSFLLITFPVTYALRFDTAALAISAVKGISVLSKPLFLITELCGQYIYFIIDNLGTLDFMLVKAGITEFLIFNFLIIVLICGMCLYNFYIKLLKRRFVSEVKNRVGNIRKRS